MVEANTAANCLAAGSMRRSSTCSPLSGDEGDFSRRYAVRNADVPCETGAAP